jgi:DNA polymerase III subunit delta'
MTFADIVGQDPALAILRRALGSGRLAHAYLFDGPQGVGKGTAAVALGLALICPLKPGEGCGKCEQCQRVLARNHPDAWLFDAAGLQDAAKASGDKSAVKYAARQVFPYALAAPHEAASRLLVIDHADELSPDVQNTLLKTLEEPRPAVHIVLVTAARESLLPTVLSRTQRIRFLPVGIAALGEVARRRGLDPARAETAAVLAGGSVARLLELATTEGEVGPWPEVTRLREAAGGKGASAMFDVAAALGEKESKDRLPEVLALLASFYRDALAVAVGADDLVMLRQRGPEVERVGRTGLHGLQRALRAVQDAEEALLANVNAVTALERLLMEMRACERKATA